MIELIKTLHESLAEPFLTRPVVPLPIMVKLNDHFRDLGLPICPIMLGRPQCQSAPVLVTLMSGGLVVAQYDFQHNYWLSSVPGTDPIPTSYVLEWSPLSSQLKGIKPAREA